MDVEIRIVPDRESHRVVIETSALTPEVETLRTRLEGAMEGGFLTGRKGERTYLLDPAALVRFYAEDKGVFAQSEMGETYALKIRLYELEEKLDRHTFVRISHSEMVNLKKVTALDLKLSGTIQMTLAGGVVCYVSRRYVKKIKEALGL